MTPDEQETYYHETENTNRAIYQYFVENLPRLVIIRHSYLSQALNCFKIINFKDKRETYYAPQNPEICFSPKVLNISVGTDAWELNLNDPETPKKIMDFLSVFCLDISEKNF